MNIIDYIPKGRENAVTRAELCRKIGLPDRTVRELISQADGKPAYLMRRTEMDIIVLKKRIYQPLKVG